MSNLNENPRWTNYCLAHSKTTEQMLAEGLYKFPLWNERMIEKFKSERPDCFFVGHLSDHSAYDEWLTKEATK